MNANLDSRKKIKERQWIILHEWVKDYQRISTEIDVLDYHIKKGSNVATGNAKKTIDGELNVMLNETNKALIKKEDQLLALKEISTMFTGIEHNVFVKRHIENQQFEIIAHDLGTSSGNVKKINMELLNTLEFYSEFN